MSCDILDVRATAAGVESGGGIGATLNAAVLSGALVWLSVREPIAWPVMVLHGLNSAFAYLLVPLLV